MDSLHDQLRSFVSKPARNMRVNILTLLLACSLAYKIDCRRSFAFHFKSTQCVANPHLISLFECSVHEVNFAPGISMDIILAENVDKLTFDLLVMFPNGRQDFVLFNVNQMDGCMFLENTSPFPLVAIIRKEFQKYSNFPTKCPVAKGTSIKVRGLKLDPESFPNYVPETKFYVRVRVFESGVHFFNLTINGTCEYTRKLYKGRG